jgi:predicted regulator of Ras-like GTPase activity (Roadblock/LC7/MglB family)
MDAASALADLTEISSQVEAAVVFDDAGAVVASTLGDAERSARLARAALDLLGAADKRFASGDRALTQLEAALREGSVFVAREEGRSIIATTSPEPTSGLVFYDLKTCLRSLAGSKSEAKPARPKRRSPKEESDA